MHHHVSNEVILGEPPTGRNTRRNKGKSTVDRTLKRQLQQDKNLVLPLSWSHFSHL